MPDQQKIDDKVANWLRTEGYRIEFETARAFERVHLSARMGVYVGSEPTTRREIDVCADHSPWPAGPGTLGKIRIICECKYLRQPWVMLYGADACTDPLYFLTTPKTKTLKAMGATPRDRDSLRQTFHFRGGLPVAHNVIEAFRRGDDKDRAYAAMMKLADVSRISADGLDELNVGGLGHVHAIFLPLAVVAGPLLAASYDADAKDLNVKEVPWGRVNWAGGRSPMLIDIVRLDHIHEYVAEAAESAVLLGKLMAQFVAAGTDA